LFGRQRELATLTEALERASDTSCAVIVEGPAGIGKSSVLGAAVDHARSLGHTVRLARPTPAESALGFTVLGDLLRGSDLDGLADEQRRALDVAVGRRRPSGAPPRPATLGGALVDLLDHRRHDEPPLVLVVDDLQWADPASLALVEFVARRLPAAGVVLLAAWRRDGPPTTALPGASHLELGELDTVAIEQIVRSVLAAAAPESLVGPIVAAAGGNPLFAAELARDAGRFDHRPGRPLPLPESLDSAIAERVRRLPGATVEALAAVALLARPTTAGLAELGLLDALHEAEVADVVRLDGRRISFTHPLLASAAHDAVSATRRLGLHTRLATITEGVERSVHLALGATVPDPHVAVTLMDAAVDLVARGAPAEAADLALLAVDATAVGDEERWSRLAAAADALFRCGRTEEAVAHLEAVRAGAADATVRCHALLALATIEYDRSDDSEHAARLAREVLASTGDTDLLAEAHTILAFVVYTDFVEAAAHADAALALVEQRAEPDGRRLADALTAAANARFRAGHGLDRAAFERAIELQEGLPIPAADSAFGSLAAQLKYADELDEARAMLEALARDADPGSLPYALGHLPQLHLWAGDWEAARRCAQRHLELSERTGQSAQEHLAHFNLAMVAAFHGDVAAAESIGTELAAYGREHGVPWTERNGTALLGFVAMSTNDAARAVEMFGRYDELGEGMHLEEPGYCRFHGDFVEALIATGDTLRAADVVERLEDRSRRVGRVFGIATARRGRALLAATRGDRDAAYEEARAATATLTGTPLAYERARALLTEGVVARRFKDRGTARRALSSAFAEFERMGAMSLAERTRHELERIAGRTPGDGHGGQQLTATEQRVATRAAAGDTTRQIADALFVSTKTVEANLTRIYRKLGVTNRAQLAGRLSAARSTVDEPGPPQM